MTRLGVLGIVLLIASVATAVAQVEIPGNRLQQPPGTRPAEVVSGAPVTAAPTPSAPPASHSFDLQLDTPQQRETLIRHLELERQRNPPKRVAPLPAQAVTPSTAPQR